MRNLRTALVATFLALPLVSVAALTAEAGSRGHSSYSGYSNHGGYSSHDRGYGRRDHRAGRKSWYRRFNAYRGSGRRHH